MQTSQQTGEIPLVFESTHQLGKRELGRQSRAFAAGLRKMGVEPGDRVLVASQNRIEWLVVHQAIRILDAIHVAVNPRSTATEGEFIAADTGANVAVLDLGVAEALYDGLRRHGLAHIVTLDATSRPGVVTMSSVISQQASAAQGSDDSVANARMIVYTSGTTGTPKGAYLYDDGDPTVLQEYLASTRFDQLNEPDEGARQERRLLINMPVHHASGPRQATAALSAGHVVVLQRKFDAEQTLALIDRSRITDWSCVPTMLARILALPADTVRGYRLESLERVVVGGAPVSAQLKARFHELVGRPVLYETYGCTETSLISGSEPIDNGTAGTLFRHVDVLIRDEGGATLSRNQVGAIWARTPRVISGYFGQEVLGAQYRTPEGYFRTGDLGKLDDEGRLHVVGREKDLVISGGTNIYPVEVERVLEKHPHIEGVAVFGIPDAEMGERVVAAVKLKANANISPDEVVLFSREHLSPHKVPREVVIVESFPRNNKGEIRKGELRETLRSRQ